MSLLLKFGLNSEIAHLRQNRNRMGDEIALE